MRTTATCLAALGLLVTLASGADDPVFSGPQPGEMLAPFTVRGVFDDEAGREYDPVARAAGGPILLVFVHEATRPSVALTRMLMTYATRHADRGLSAGVVWLADDATEAEQFLRRARHAMAPGVPIGISVDGAEGPGAYGLNRKVTLTILVAKAGKVTANFALVQPSAQADAPKILTEVAGLIGVEAPKSEELAALAQNAMQPAATAEADPRLTELLRNLIRKDAEPEQVDRAAEAIDAYLAEHPTARAQLNQIVRRIIDAGRLDSYGTPRAREHLRRWTDPPAAPAQGEGGTRPEAPKSSDPKGDR